MDFGALTRSYSRWGRRALHPRTLLGLIIYGVQRRQWSLRELEVLAKCDAGAWLMCGGHQPDHSTIGKFIHMYREALSDEFYVDLVQQVARKLNLRPGVAALDGTVIEAASSRFRLLREEAARAAAEQAQAAAAAEQAPAAAPPSALAQQARQTQEAAAAAEERDERRHAAGLKGEIKVAATEPEAVHQPRKDGVRRACYKPSVLVEQSEAQGESGPFKVQLIAAQGVHPSSEPALFNRLVDQHNAGFGCDPITLLTDAGYASLAILAASCERELDLLCPTGLFVSDRNHNPRERSISRRSGARQWRLGQARQSGPIRQSCVCLRSGARPLSLSGRSCNCSPSSATTPTARNGATCATKEWHARTAPCAPSVRSPQAPVRLSAIAKRNSKRGCSR